MWSTDVFSKQTQRQIDETLPSNHAFRFEHEGCPYELGTLNTGKYYLFKHDKITGYATHGLICNNIFALFKAMNPKERAATNEEASRRKQNE